MEQPAVSFDDLAGIEDPAPERLAQEVARRLGPANGAGGAVFERLWCSEHSEAWLLCWPEDHDAGFHDHDESAGGVAVLRGELVEQGLALGGPAERHTVRAGESYGFTGDHIHRVLHPAGALSVHVYAPPLRRLGSYRVEDGLLRRTSRRADVSTEAEPSLG